jgi:hypothetical protein
MIVKEVAERAHLTIQEVNRQIRVGRLKATFNLKHKQNEVSEVDFQNWQANRRGRGRPKGDAS